MIPEDMYPNNDGALATPKADTVEKTTIFINIENIYIDQGSHFEMMPPAEELPDPDLFEVGAGL